MKIKKLYPLGVALSLAATLGINGFALAAGSQYIHVKTRAEGSQSTTTCYIYDSSANPTDPACDESYGSYDSTSNTLTLGTGINGLPNGRVDIKVDDLKVSASANIESAINDSGSDNWTLDFNNYSFTGTTYKITDNQEADSHSDFSDQLTIKSGTYNNVQFNGDSIKIDGGTINTDPQSTIPVNMKDSIDITGGTINIPGCGIALSADNFNMSDGVINATDIETTGINIQDDGSEANITGGQINLKSKTNTSESAAFGILLNKGRNLTISGGEITLDSFKWGISGNNSKIYFNGGVTYIKNSKDHSIWIKPAVDPEHDIVFGDDMGIKENTYVFWDDTSTGIAESGTVTIAKGYEYRRHYGWETIDDEEESIGVPDTGTFSGEDGNGIMAMVSLGLLALVSGGAYTVQYAAKRHHNSMKFRK